MNEENEPDRLAELAKGGEALRGQMEPVVRAAQQFVRDAQQAKARGGPALPFAQRVALAVDAGIRELVPEPKRPVAHHRTAGLVVNISSAASARVTTGAGLTIQPVFGAVRGDTAAATETVAVEVLDSRRGLAGLNAGQILALVLVWLLLLAMPVAIVDAKLSQEAQQAAEAYYAVAVALAVKITFRIVDTRK